MVLQRDQKIPVWGWAEKGEEVTVSFAGQELKAMPDENGRWKVVLSPVPVNKNPQKMIIKGKNQLNFPGILVGDVWLCSGQSNMAWKVWSTLNSVQECAKANYPLIRQVTIGRNSSAWPIKNMRGCKWLDCNPETVKGFTAAGFYFARKVFEETGVPIGLINDNWGGTRIEAWIPFEGFRQVDELKKIYDRLSSNNPTSKAGLEKFNKYLETLEAWTAESKAAAAKGIIPEVIPMPPGFSSDPRAYQSPAMIYNAMVNPIASFAIKGTLWYQGEANGGEGESYYHKMTALIKGWREVWGQGDFPFYFVQLPNYRAVNRNNPAGGDGWAKIRAAQLKTLSLPNTGMAVTIDVGEARDIHPKNKQDVGKRLAALALANLYGKDVLASGPLYKDYKVEENKIRISFNFAKGGLVAGTKEGLKPVVEVKDSEIKWFAVAGSDKKWHWGEAQIDGETVLVSSEKVAAPIAVRYAYTANPEGAKLYNKAGIPASPFRTDSW
ncbi:MAG: sialate O-acetylesterase [Planctomycetota bacterium]